MSKTTNCQLSVTIQVSIFVLCHLENFESIFLPHGHPADLYRVLTLAASTYVQTLWCGTVDGESLKE